MRHEVCPAQADELVELVLARRGEADCEVLPVYRQGQLVGLLSGENIGEYLMIQAALDEVSRGRSG
jgi:predicted transcriptional regulator